VLDIRNPATGEVIESLATDDAASVGRKLVRAAAAQRAWARLPFRDRASCVERFRAWVQDHAARLAGVLTAETGKPIRQARAEVLAVDGRFAMFLERTEHVLAPQEVLPVTAGGTGERITWDPLGVVANISAWNYPWFVGVNVFVPALLAGNAVLYKPSEHASRTGREIARGLHAAGVPEEVFAPVYGAGAAGAALLQPPVRGVYFTGSHATGVKVASAAAPHLMRVQLELGGKDPLYVTDDVDAAWAAAAACEGAMYNAGQSCCAVERLYVHRNIHDAFVEALVAETRKLRVGDPADEATDVGPLCRAAQLDVLDAQVRDAVEKGARLACGGGRGEGPGAFFDPTVLLGCHHGMSVMTEESFGPVIGVQAVADDAEALARMRDTRYGLTAAVYARDRGRAEAILGGVSSGTAYWNCCDRVSPRLPWSGRGHSGVGATLGDEGIRAFAEARAWHLRPAPEG
jgi:acyl-CoA reductase-like NAD-dependent aldehyde dehydrogenase